MKRSTKVWMRNDDDAKVIKRQGGITLWASSKHATKKRKTSAAMQKDERVSLLISSLRSIHGEKYNALQYGLWAEMINTGTHASQDTPPNAPMIQSFSEKKSRRGAVATAISDLGKAMASATSSSNVDRQSTNDVYSLAASKLRLFNSWKASPGVAISSTILLYVKTSLVDEYEHIWVVDRSFHNVTSKFTSFGLRCVAEQVA